MKENIKEEQKEERVKQAADVSSKDEIKMNINNSLLLIVVILVVMSGVQVFQMQGIQKAIASGSIKTTTTQTQQGSAIGLPSQVGGCG